MKNGTASTPEKFVEFLINEMGILDTAENRVAVYTRLNDFIANSLSNFALECYQSEPKQELMRKIAAKLLGDRETMRERLEKGKS